jgi:hypothetical protein
MESGWRAVQAQQQVGGASGTVRLTPGQLTPTGVTVTIEVDAAAGDAVWFSDGLYGATAWTWDGTTWHRADTADMRTMVAPSLGPGERSEVTLPLAGERASVRVLVRTPGDGLGAWTDVSV